MSRHRRRIGTLFISLVLAVSMLGAVGPSTPGEAQAAANSATNAQVSAQAAKKWRPQTGAKFNVPRVGGERMYRLERAVIAAINHARPKTTIKMAMFSFDRVQVSDALIRAKRRKVRVQVIVNGHEFPRAQRDLKRVLGKRYKKKRVNGKVKRVKRKNFFYQCKASCRGDGDVQHSKFILFEKSGAARKVTMLGSLNMKLNGVKNQFNDLLTIRSKKMYNKLNIIFNEMSRDNIYKDSHRVYRQKKRYKLEVMPYPRKKATKKTRWTPKRDPIIRLLRPVKCKGARTNDGRTIVRVNMHAWDKSRGALIANRFRDLYAEGCNVKLMVGFAGAKVRNIFARPTKRGLVPIRSTGFDTNGDQQIDLYSHDKILTVNGHYGQKHDRKMTVTGSSNYQNGGQYGDELIFRIYSPKIYRQYADNWGYVWRNHTHGFKWSRTSALRGGPTWVGPQYTLTDGLGTDSPEWQDE